MSMLTSKIIDILVNPINKFLVIATFLTSLLLFLFNFLPEDILNRTRMLDFFNQYTYILVIVMVFTFFLLIVQESAKWYKKREDKKFAEFFRNEQDKLFEDKDAKMFLNYLYESHPQSALLPKNNQKVKLLVQYQLIHQASSIQLVPGYETNNPSFPYILQPYAEEKLKEIHGIKSSQ